MTRLLLDIDLTVLSDAELAARMATAFERMQEIQRSRSRKHQRYHSIWLDCLNEQKRRTA